MLHKHTVEEHNGARIVIKTPWESCLTQSKNAALAPKCVTSRTRTRNLPDVGLTSIARNAVSLDTATGTVYSQITPYPAQQIRSRPKPLVPQTNPSSNDGQLPNTQFVPVLESKCQLIHYATRTCSCLNMMMKVMKAVQHV